MAGPRRQWASRNVTPGSRKQWAAIRPKNQTGRTSEMANGIDGEQFLLRNQASDALGYYSPFYNSVLIPMAVFEGQDEQLLSALFHEKTHWAQFNLSPWGQ